LLEEDDDIDLSGASTGSFHSDYLNAACRCLFVISPGKLIASAGGLLQNTQHASRMVREGLAGDTVMSNL
jgi:hypothetical protein